MPNVSISIPEQMRNWIDSQIKQGRYTSTSDYMRDLIRNDQRSREQLDQLLLNGINSGPSAPLDMETIKANKAKARKRLESKKP